MKAVIINYGMGNLNSVQRACQECGAEAIITDNPADLRGSQRVILPGVGSFPDAMRNLNAGGWSEAIKSDVVTKQVPLLGICLGMQLFASRGWEEKETRGLGIIAGETIRLEPKAGTERIPHVGWNNVYQSAKSPLFDCIRDGADFYFVHSYHFLPDNPSCAVANTPYCGNFIAAIQQGNIFGVQFHPEKSGSAGFQLLRNFFKIVSREE